MSKIFYDTLKQTIRLLKKADDPVEPVEKTVNESVAGNSASGNISPQKSPPHVGAKPGF